MSRVSPWHQTNWDWRAAGNFICGGAGAGLIAFSMLGHVFGAAYRLPALIGVALIGAGLVFVWAEIGRPLRALNVYLHPQTSWMTREAMVAPFLFASTLAAAWTGSGVLALVAGLLALAYLTCQAQMIRESKGIPAWRSPRVVPLVMLTGLSEGAAIAMLAASAGDDHAYLQVIEVVLLSVVFARGLAWYAYRSGLQRDGAPVKALKALSGIELPFAVLGNWVPALMLMVGLASSREGMTVHWATGVAAVAALGAGWLFKFVLIARAAYNQGFALPRTPVRGAGKGGAATKPGWNSSPH